MVSPEKPSDMPRQEGLYKGTWANRFSLIFLTLASIGLTSLIFVMALPSALVLATWLLVSALEIVVLVRAFRLDVLVEGSHVEVRNLFRTYDIPLGSIVAVTWRSRLSGFQLRIDLDDGGRIHPLSVFKKNPVDGVLDAGHMLRCRLAMLHGQPLPAQRK